jgi:preprotein translocase subunit SecG
MFLNLVQILICLLLTALILLQAKGTGLGTAFGGQSQTYHSKRGVEKAIFYLTVSLSVLFVVISLLALKL